MWWNNINENFLAHILTKINDSRSRSNSVDSCSDLFDALNKCWQQHNLALQQKHNPSDSESIQNLLIQGIEITKQMKIAVSNELKRLVQFEPRIMNHDELRKANYDPNNFDRKLKKKAEEEHKQLLKAYVRFFNENQELDYLITLIKKTAQLLYVVRSNIKHGEKTPKGPDLSKAERDRKVCEITKPLLEHIFEYLFDYPSKKLAIYGTLLPGEINYDIISNIRGEWTEAKTKGKKEVKDNLPTFLWDISAEYIDIKVFISDQMDFEFERLDRFEGDMYNRILIPVKIHDKTIVANIYAWRN